MKPEKYVSIRLIAFSIVALLMFAATAPTFAQASKKLQTPKVVWKANLGKQLVDLLESPIAKQQQRGLQLTNHYATQHGDEFDLRATVPSLLAIYDNASEENYRIMALAALHAVGDPGSMYHLVERLPQESSPRVRRITVAALVAHARQNTFLQEPLAEVAVVLGTTTQ